jgi:hypothetical protein
VTTRDEVMGKTVYGSEGEEVGTVTAVFDDRETGELEWLAVGSGLLGRKRFLVPVVGTDVRETGVFLTIPSDKVETTPEIEGEQISEEQERRLYSHYGIRYSERRSPSGLPEGRSGTERESGGRSRRSQARRQPSRSRRQGGSRANDAPTREELYEEAQRLGIEGRSKMDKSQLARAVGRRRGGTSEGTRGRASPFEVQRFLEGVGYPAGKRELVKEAKTQGASSKVRSTLERLPDERFDTAAEVSEAIGKMS